MSSRPLLRPLCDPYAVLLEKSELYLAVVNRWAAREGHERLVQEKVGIGKLAAIVGLAARSLLPDTPTHSLETLQRKSGLSPLAYKTALDHLQAAIDDHNKRQLAPRTPRKDYRSLSSPSYSYAGSDPRTPKSSAVRREKESAASGSGLSLKEKAQAVQSGAAFGLGTSSPRTPHSHHSRTSSSSAASPFRSPAQLHKKIAEGDTPVASPSTSRLRGEVPATPSSRLIRAAQAATPTGGASRTSTPKSVRFEATCGRNSRALAAEYDDGEEGQRTPSKRRRMSDRLEVGDDDVEMGSPSSSARSSRRATDPHLDRRVRRKTSGTGRSSISELDDDLPFVLFPLSRKISQGTKTQEKQVEEGQAVIKQWLHVWADRLDEDSDSQEAAIP
ncbi:hypothetical protein BCV69DRAFT_283192 [Microstroma glucosiphilum]|uniref:Uncharacterized protein n=1 Tax=Pseudomicrostroma glucosiphilum TaxID=1684307 RepID=A0A316U504_9BASI|nr:hypothetical protein BCV69DRAFT_283192 [Pseudomicrostroma glucosiphilum]PWN20316.1 hypothetical protein BCV69DRAFT_283192 [Pseudomicrostroma glucosiphilum]